MTESKKCFYKKLAIDPILEEKLSLKISESAKKQEEFFEDFIKDWIRKDCGKTDQSFIHS